MVIGNWRFVRDGIIFGTAFVQKDGKDGFPALNDLDLAPAIVRIDRIFPYGMDLQLPRPIRRQEFIPSASEGPIHLAVGVLFI